MEILLISKQQEVLVEMGAAAETVKMVSVEILKMGSITNQLLRSKVALVEMEVMELSVETEETGVTLISQQLNLI